MTHRRIGRTVATVGLALLALLSGASQPSRARVRVGIDVLEDQGFAPLRGKRVGLITNQSGRTSAGLRTVDVLAKAKDVKLVALFSPEHGLEGEISEGGVGDAVDSAAGLRVQSLYGKTRRPTDEMLKGIDVLVFDIQDAGVRFFTYETTMAYAMEEAAKRGIEFVVLDRPNPLGGTAVNGPMLDADRLSFEGYFPLPLRHGMTMGELAQLFNAERKIGAKLTVVPMKGWGREMWFDDTGLEWVNPSPSLRSLTGNTLYPAVELLREGGVSVGRGTPKPFELFGAPWMDGDMLAAYLESRHIPGVRFHSIQFTPTEDVQANEICRGVRLELTDRNALDVGQLGVELMAALGKLHPEKFQIQKCIRLLGSKKTLERLRAGDDPAEIVEEWTELEAFQALRAKYLLYD